MILSTGMSRPEEVGITVDFLNRRSAAFVLLHCNSTYPAPLHDINLKWMHQLREVHPLVGYSGHERGINVSLAAVALGACVIERHFTLDRAMEGPDHAASLTYAEFKRLIEGIREIEDALGEGKERQLSQGEMINRENLGKSLVSTKALTKGAVLTTADIKVRSPGQGLSPQSYERLLGRTLRHDMIEEDFFYPSDLTDDRIEPRSYHFSRPWGVPVRYHDFQEYQARIKPDLFEFHLSYSDMELKPEDFMNGIYPCGFVVHAPELFANSRLMDLASPDEAYRAQSVIETQRVIDITRHLKRFFPQTTRPMIVANIGGFTMDEPLPPTVIPDYYERFAESLGELDMVGVELIPQTMAPFPWHFGGQRYQNIFVKIEEIVEWCGKLKLRMCFDISHTRGLKAALKPDGTITLEFPHLMRLIEHTQFDTVYHEHFSYLSLYTVQRIFKAAGLRVWHIEELPTHGGSLRIFGCHADDARETTEAVVNLLATEAQRGLQAFATYQSFQAKADRVKDDLLAFLVEQKRAGKAVAAYGAAAKGNTLLNYAGVKPDLLPFVCDAAAAKQGKFMPGSHIPILAPAAMLEQPPDYLVILPWNIAAEVKQQNARLAALGTKFVTAVPKLDTV